MNVKLSVGVNDKDSKRQVFDAFTAENIIYDILQARKVDGCTMDTARVFYTRDDGATVREESVRVEITGITEVMVRIICNDIKIALNQESIMVEYVSAPNIMFI